MQLSVQVEIQGKCIEAVDCHNISMGGMCLIFQDFPQDGDSGRIRISKWHEYDAALNFVTDFRKVWVRPATIGSSEKMVGIIFRNLSPAQKKILSIMMRQEALMEK